MNRALILICFTLCFLNNSYADCTRVTFDRNKYWLGNERNVFSSITFDGIQGLIVEVDVYSSGDPLSMPEKTIYFKLPLTVANRPNPSFDRLYALVMKGAELNSLMDLCSTTIVAVSKDSQKVYNELSKLTIYPPRNVEKVQKVQICNSLNSSCVEVFDDNALKTRNVIGPGM